MTVWSPTLGCHLRCGASPDVEPETDIEQLAARILANAGPQVVDGPADGWATRIASPGLDSSTAMDRKAGGECSWRETRGRLAQ